MSLSVFTDFLFRLSGILFPIFGITIIRYAKLNNLDPYNYITWLLKGATYENFTDPKELDKYMPWNAPESMKVPALLKETGSTNASDKSAEQSCAS